MNTKYMNWINFKILYYEQKCKVSCIIERNNCKKYKTNIESYSFSSLLILYQQHSQTISTKIQVEIVNRFNCKN